VSLRGALRLLPAVRVAARREAPVVALDHRLAERAGTPISACRA
jgi:hypothetical protein